MRTCLLTRYRKRHNVTCLPVCVYYIHVHTVTMCLRLWSVVATTTVNNALKMTCDGHLIDSCCHSFCETRCLSWFCHVTDNSGEGRNGKKRIRRQSSQSPPPPTLQSDFFVLNSPLVKSVTCVTPLLSFTKLTQPYIYVCVCVCMYVHIYTPHWRTFGFISFTFFFVPYKNLTAVSSLFLSQISRYAAIFRSVRLRYVFFLFTKKKKTLFT